MNTAIVAQPMKRHTVTKSPNVPEKQLYWQGYDMYVECAINGDWLTTDELAAMTQEERRGYETAARHQADADTEAYLVSLNTNAFGDYTQGAW